MASKRTVPTEPPKPAEKLSRVRQRQKLIDACISALYLHGPSRTTIDKVVSIADMSPGIVNFYFETKAALLLSALEHLAVEFEERVLAPLEELREQPVQALERLIELYLDPDIASPRKVSVWYSFWGEASSRREYHAICGKRDVAFADLVRGLVERLIARTQATHLDADAVALGLIGALEILWQDIAFCTEADLDRERARARCRAYLRSVFPQHFGRVRLDLPDAASGGPLPGWAYGSEAVFMAERSALFHGGWQWLAHAADLPAAGSYVAADLAGEPSVAVRDAQSTVRVFRNACARRPHVVATGYSGRFPELIACAADGYQYGLDGASLDGQHGGLAALAPAWAPPLLFVKCAVEASDVPVPVIADAVRLDALVPVGDWIRADCRANWKVVVEHWADVYLAAEGNLRTAGLAGEIERTEDGSGIVWRMTPDGKGRGWSGVRYANLLGGIGQDGLRPEWVRQVLWPNLFVEARPDGATIRQVLPVAAGLSAIRVRHYARGGGGRTGRALSVLARRLGDAWAEQDKSVLSSTQAGLLAPSELQSPDNGLMQNRFWTWLRCALPGRYVNPARPSN